MDNGNKQIIDAVVIGSGPAGLTAGIYIARALLKCVIYETQMPGGKMAETYEIENYAGFTCVKGIDLSLKMLDHAQHFGCQLEYDKVVKVTNASGKIKIIHLESGAQVRAKAIVVASGTRFRKLNVPGEKQYFSHGVSTCAVCDAAIYKGDIVAVIGAGNSATEEALYLTKFVKKVYLIHRTEKFRASVPNIMKVRNHKQIELILNTIVVEIKGNQKKVTELEIHNTKTNKNIKLAISCVFVYIGQIPNTQFLSGQLEQDKLLDNGFIKIVNDKCATVLSGVFAAGDVVSKSLRQIGNAVGEGTIAGQAAVNYIDNLE